MHSSVHYGVKNKKVQRKKYILNCGAKKNCNDSNPSVPSQVEDEIK